LDQLLQKDAKEDEVEETKEEEKGEQEKEEVSYSITRSDYTRKMKIFESIRIKSFPVTLLTYNSIL